jgi:hypothetical protein
MRDGRQCLWRIYAHFALPGVESAGLRITFAVVDLTSVELVGGDLGLEDFWNRWCDCVSRVADNPARSTYQRLFANEMCESKMMQMCVRDYDEQPYDHAERTWEFMEMKGRACFERARQRENLSQTQHSLSGEKTTPAGDDGRCGSRCPISTARWTGPGPSDSSTDYTASLIRAIGLMLHFDQRNRRFPLRRNKERLMDRAGLMELGHASG